MKCKNLERDFWDLKASIACELETIKNNWFIKWIIRS